MKDKSPLEEIKDHGYWRSDSYIENKKNKRPSPIRSIYKTISWRVIATTDTFFISWFITGYFTWATAIASVEVFTKMGLYYVHERGWARIQFKRPW
mgnify:FL=1